MRRPPCLNFLLAAALITTVTLLAYGDALRLPFFFDDMNHYVWLRGQTLTSIFLTAAGRPYYRPLQFFLWKVYETFTGQDSVMLYHALSVIVHIVCALLVMRLVRRLTRDKDRWWPAILAGLIFVLFPFSYQVVTLPASFTHPMAALFTILSVLSYDRFRMNSRVRWLAAALLSAVLAFGSNEGTLLIFGLIALTEFLGNYPRRQWRWTATFAALGMVYFLWYRSRPSDNADPLALRSLETIFQNAVYALQGLTFPVQPFGRVLMQWGTSDQVAVLLLGVSALIALAIVYARAQKMQQFIYGAGWYAVCLAAPVLLLSHNYFIDAPRVLYLGSIGAAWLWANAIGIIANPIGSHARLRQGLAIALALGTLIPSFMFIRQRMDLHHLNAAPLNQALEVARQSDRDAQLLFVNLPAWISTPQFWYPIGHEGVLFMPGYSSMADFVSTNLNRRSPATGVEFNSLSVPQPYYYGVYGPALGWEQLIPLVQQADRVYFTRYAPDRIDLVEAGQITEQDRGAMNRFGETTLLETANWALCNGQLQVRLIWQTRLTGDWRVFVHVLNPDGSLAAQHDSPPLMGLYPFWQFRAGDHVEDVHTLDVSNLARNQVYTIAVGLYDPATGQRLAATDLNGQPQPDNAVRLGGFTLSGNDACR
jgi:chromate transport protein ChrA